MSRTGRKAFDTCNVRTTEFTDYGLIASDDKRAVRPIDKIARGEKYYYYGATAKLHCPKTEDDRTVIETKSYDDSTSGAGKRLRSLAGAILCNTCPYPGMSEVEVSIYRGDLARAEAERLQAYKLLEQARQDIASLDLPNEDI